VGDADPLQGIEDALRTFPADEILVVAHRDDEPGWLEEGAGATAQARFSLRVTRVTAACNLVLLTGFVSGVNHGPLPAAYH